MLVHDGTSVCAGRCVWQVLVHGEQNEMARLKAALIREYEDDAEYNIEVYNPRNTQAVELQFRGEKMAKVRSRPPPRSTPFSSYYSCQAWYSRMIGVWCCHVAFVPLFVQVVGSLAAKRSDADKNISGLLVKRNFNYHIMAPHDLPSKWSRARYRTC